MQGVGVGCCRRGGVKWAKWDTFMPAAFALGWSLGLVCGVRVCVHTCLCLCCI